MSKFIIINREDDNEKFEVSGDTDAQALIAALEELGWMVAYCDDEDFEKDGIGMG